MSQINMPYQPMNSQRVLTTSFYINKHPMRSHTCKMQDLYLYGLGAVVDWIDRSQDRESEGINFLSFAFQERYSSIKEVEIPRDTIGKYVNSTSDHIGQLFNQITDSNISIAYIFFFDCFYLCEQCGIKYAINYLSQQLAQLKMPVAVRQVLSSVTQFFSQTNENITANIAKYCDKLIAHRTKSEAFEAKPCLRILFVANVSAGKSTLINALVGKKINRMSNSICTTKIERIYNNPQVSGITYIDEQKRISRQYNLELSQNERNSIIDIATAFHDSSLYPKVCLIDTPGENNADAKSNHKQITEKAIKDGLYDIVVHVSNGTSRASLDEESLLKFLHKHCEKPIIFVLNQLDNFNAEDDSIAESIKKHITYLNDVGFSNPDVIPLSSRAALLLRIPQDMLTPKESITLKEIRKQLAGKFFDLPSYIERKASATSLERTGIVLLQKKISDYFTAWMEAAEHGDSKALYELGKNYEENGDLSHAIDVWVKSAYGGYVSAQYKLCHVYMQQAQWWSMLVKGKENKLAQTGIVELATSIISNVQGQQLAVDNTTKQEEDAEAYFQEGMQYYTREEYEQAVTLFKKAAMLGHASAQYQLGLCYYWGVGIQKDYTQATFVLRDASLQGDSRAQYLLGWCMYYGQGVERNVNSAVSLFMKSAEQNNSEAQCMLGVCYYDGNGFSQDYTQAVKWFRESAVQGYNYAQCLLGNCYYDGKGVAQDYKQAISWYEKAAAQGNVNAQRMLGICYYYGKGVAPDPKQAFPWYEKAAMQGNRDAQLMLGNFYIAGDGVKQDYKQAISWYKKAAGQGDRDAQYMLGFCYYSGRGTAQDYEEAISWYEKAAEQGDSRAQYMLGECYYNGNGYDQDYEEAVTWYEKAAAQGHSDAQYSLGWCYENGQGVEQDYEEAFIWYEKAAVQGHCSAQYELGKCYYYGYGIEEDEDEAYNWLEKSANQGFEQAQEFIDEHF